MDIIEELKNYKRHLGFSNEEIARRSGIPLGTVQKIFGGATRSPRRKTLLKLEQFFRDPDKYENADASEVSDVTVAYNASDKDAPDAFDDPGWIVKKNTEDDPLNENGRLIFTRQGTYTIDDLYALPDGVRAELIDGVIYELSAPSLEHQSIVLEIAVQLRQCADEHGCMVFISPFDVQLDMDNKTMIEPDIAVLCDKEKASLIQNVYGAPEFVIEVLSKSTRRRDLTIKTAKYDNAGCKEYWIVDPKNEEVLVYFFDDDNVIYHYTFNDIVSVRMSDGKCEVDFSAIKERLTWFNR